MKTLTRVIIILTGLIIAAEGAHAYPGWSFDPAANSPVCDAAGNQSFPLMISDGSNGTIIVWDDLRNGTFAIYAQRVDARGDEQWTHNGLLVFQAAVAQTSTNFQKDAIPDGNGGAIITWSAQLSGTSTGKDVLIQHVDAGGNITWTPNGYGVCLAKGDQTDPRIASDGAHGGIITWTDTRLRILSPDIFAQKISSTGLPQWELDGIPIDTTATGSQGLPMIIADDAGGAVIAWADARHLTYFDVYAQKINANGEWQWDSGSVSASTLADGKFLTGLTTDGGGGAILCWQQSQSTYQLTVAQRINSSGTVLWGSEGTLVYNNVFPTYGPRIVSDGAGGAIIAWRDTREPSTSYDIYAQRLDGAGTKLWDTDGVAVCRAPGDQVAYAMSPSDGGTIITWQDNRDGVSTIDIYAQKVDANGTLLLGSDGIAICSSDSTQQRPAIVSNGTGSAIISWEDSRHGGTNPDIYTQLLYVPTEETVPVSDPNTPYSINGVGADFSVLGTVDSVTVRSFLNQYPPGLPKGLPLFFEIAAHGTGFAATLTFSYTDQDLSGLVNGDANLAVYSNDGAGWVLQGGTVDTSANSVTVPNVTAFSLWAIRDPLDTLTTAVRTGSGQPAAFRLDQNYPNPFNPSTVIGFDVPAPGVVTLKIYDLLGREVAVLVNERMNPGRYETVFEAHGLSSGVYFYRLTSNNTSIIRKLLLLR